MLKIFIDTGAFYAMADVSDRHHGAASDTFVARAGVDELFTTDHVLVETWQLLNARLNRHAAMLFWETFESGVVVPLGVTSRDLWRARRIASQWRDHDFSIVDCTSFAVVERQDIRHAMAYDSHFEPIRLGPRGRRALRLV